MTATRDPNAEHCLELVKSNDLDRYLSTLLADREKQRALFAIYAFDADVSSIAGQITEPGIGEIRLQWWRDELDAVYGGNCDNHPVARELQPVVHKYDLPKHLFSKLIDSQQTDVYRQPMDSLDDLLKHLTIASSAITDLASRVLIGYDALEIEFLINKAGIARGLSKAVSSLPRQAARNHCLLPSQMLHDRDTNAQEIFSGDGVTGARLVVAELCHLVSKNLQEIRQDQGILKKVVLPAFFPASLAGLLCDKIARTSDNPITSVATISQLKMQMFLMKKSFFEQV